MSPATNKWGVKMNLTSFYVEIVAIIKKVVVENVEANEVK